MEMIRLDASCLVLLCIYRNSEAKVRAVEVMLERLLVKQSMESKRNLEVRPQYYRKALVNFCLLSGSLHCPC